MRLPWRSRPLRGIPAAPPWPSFFPQRSGCLLQTLACMIFNFLVKPVSPVIYVQKRKIKMLFNINDINHPFSPVFKAMQEVALTQILKRGSWAAFPLAERMRDFRMSRQDVGESRAAPGMARPGGPAEILKQ
ncbi:hypothetical protein [Pantoea ananatis]|uniref:hypothetical protein n=1 Tax=Pantoea ananas TaxID=553 RepID=UPI0021AC50D2|nr:hypothetical protein [Pantoea ananatis]